MTKSSITIMISQLPKLLLDKQRLAIYFCSLFVLLSFVALYSVLHQNWLSIYISELRNISIFTLLFSLTASFVYKKISPLYVLVIALCLMAISLAMHAFYLNNQQNPIYLLLMIHFVFILGLAYAVPAMITCIAMNSSIQNRGMATSLYTSILFIGASLGAVLPTMFNSNTLIFFIVFFLIFNAVQLILSLKNRTYQ